jgi:hypothetical protein
MVSRPLANSELTSLEVLCHAALSDKEPLLLDIYTSTEAILFLGTSHRGSSHADTAEILRRIVSALGFDAPDQNIRALQINGAELERIHGYFMKLYEQQDRYPFKVVTFQESKGLAGTNRLNLNKRVDLSPTHHEQIRPTFIRSSSLSRPRLLVRSQPTQSTQTICQCAGFRANLTKDTGKS